MSVNELETIREQSQCQR